MVLAVGKFSQAHGLLKTVRKRQQIYEFLGSLDE